MVLLPALSLAAAVTASQPVRPAGATEPPPREASATPTRGETVRAVATMEGAYLLLSAGAAYAPEYTGAVLAVSAPLAFWFRQAGQGSEPGAARDGIEAELVFTIGVTALGLYDAFAVPRSHHDHAERFWLNLAAWHAVTACTLVTGWIAGPGDPRTAPVAISVASLPDGWILSVDGRF